MVRVLFTFGLAGVHLVKVLLTLGVFFLILVRVLFTFSLDAVHLAFFFGQGLVYFWLGWLTFGQRHV